MEHFSGAHKHRQDPVRSSAMRPDTDGHVAESHLSVRFTWSRSGARRWPNERRNPYAASRNWGAYRLRFALSVTHRDPAVPEFYPVDSCPRMLLPEAGAMIAFYSVETCFITNNFSFRPPPSGFLEQAGHLVTHLVLVGRDPFVGQVAEHLCVPQHIGIGPGFLQNRRSRRPALQNRRSRPACSRPRH